MRMVKLVPVIRRETNGSVSWRRPWSTYWRKVCRGRHRTPRTLNSVE